MTTSERLLRLKVKYKQYCTALHQQCYKHLSEQFPLVDKRNADIEMFGELIADLERGFSDSTNQNMLCGALRDMECALSICQVALTSFMACELAICDNECQALVMRVYTKALHHISKYPHNLEIISKYFYNADDPMELKLISKDIKLLNKYLKEMAECEILTEKN